MTFPEIELDRARRKTLTSQLTDGLRRAIRTGRYAPGDALPPIRALAARFNVAQAVAANAMRALTDERLVISRPHVGSIVAPRGVSIWRGSVLVVRIGAAVSYYQGSFCGGVVSRLTDAGCFADVLTLPCRGHGPVDFARLDYRLREKPDFILQIYDHDRLSSRLRASGVPFAVLRERAPVRGSVLDLRQDRFAALGDFIAQCRAAGIRSVEQHGIEPHAESVRALCAAGIGAVERLHRPLLDYGAIEGVERAGLRAFARRMTKRPDLYLFSDDFFAQGALTALLSAGVRIPEDVCVVTLSNRGSGPVFPVPLTRFEMDPADHGRQVAEMILAHLSGKPTKPLVLSGNYTVGRTFSL